MRFRVVFFGTPDFAVPSLRALIDGPDDVVGVICQADRPAGRGQKLRMPPVKVLAQEHGIVVEQPTKIRNRAFEDLLRGWNPDVVIVAAYGRILPTNILELPAHGCINVHASLLPKYRGAAPIQWAIARGESESGVTIMQMNEAMDEGDILLQRSTPIGASETAAELSERLSDLGAAALMAALAALERGELEATPQDHTAMTVAPMIAKTDGEIDWSGGAEEIAWRCRGFHPWPSTFTHLDGKLLKIHRAHSVPTGDTQPPGTVVAIGEAIEVATGDGTLAVEELQLEGRKRLSALEFGRSGSLPVERALADDTQSDPRLIAWDVLQAVEGGSYADAELARRLRGSGLDERDRGLATQLVYGSLAWQGFADHVLATLGRPAAKLDLPVRTLLRMALFQMTKLDRIPDFAVVDTSVELSKRYKSGKAAGLVNALLRGFLRSDETLQPKDTDTVGRLAVNGSHPRWLVERWIELLGAEDAEKLLEADNQSAPTVLRTNLRRTNRDQAIAVLERAGHRARPTKYSLEGIVCDLSSGLADMATWRDGLVTAQGEASQLVGQMIPPNSTRVLDACAAPGGKTTHLAERIGRRILAVDRSRAGIRNVARQATRVGVSVDAIRADARALPFDPSTRFDAALVDAPCSGLGTLRQHPEIRWRREPEDVARLARVQASILDSVAAYVAPEGSLVYATCTLLPEENEDRIEQFLEDHPEFEVTDPRPDLPEPARDLVDDDCFLRTWPHRHGLDGFFAARLKRKS